MSQIKTLSLLQKANKYLLSSKLFRLFFGILPVLLIVIVGVLSIPFLIFRQIVKLLAKVLRPDLGEILNAQSSIHVTDLFSRQPPRNNIVSSITMVKNMPLEELRKDVWDKWIRAINTSNGQLLYPKFQQYPVRWWGFTFYKHAFDTFSLDNHIFLHDKKPTTEEDLLELSEKLLNSPFTDKRSLWELHLVHNYVNPKISPEPEMSILIFKVHHSLADGFSIIKAFMEGLCGCNLSDIKLPKPKKLNRSRWDKIRFLLSSPFCAMWEMAGIAVTRFRSNPFLVPDEKKTWHQYIAKSDLIPIENMFETKDKLGVSFTSVLVSSISAAITKTIKIKNKLGELDATSDDFMLFFSVLPVPGHNKTLTNHATGNMFDIPISEFKNPIERLQICEQSLERSRSSVVPYMTWYYGGIFGRLIAPLANKLTRNKFAASGLSNFPGFCVPVEYNGRKCVANDFIAGALRGNAGIGLMVLRYDEHLRICASAEKALMTREDLQDFLKYVSEEIEILHGKAKVHA